MSNVCARSGFVSQTHDSRGWRSAGKTVDWLRGKATPATQPSFCASALQTRTCEQSGHPHLPTPRHKKSTGKRRNFFCIHRDDSLQQCFSSTRENPFNSELVQTRCLLQVGPSTRNQDETRTETLKCSRFQLPPKRKYTLKVFIRSAEYLEWTVKKRSVSVLRHLCEIHFDR